MEKELYISNEDDAIVTVVDTVNRSVVSQIEVGVEPEGMAVSPDGAVAINTTETSNFLHWIDTKTKKIIHNTLVDQRPRHIEFSKTGDRVWASSEIGGTVMIVDSTTKEPIGKVTFKIPGVFKDLIQPVGIKLTSDGKYAFIALGPANHVAVVDAKTFKVIKYLLVGKRVWQLDFAQNECKTLYNKWC
jgi:PQQ-dependent catabolism-associated beta-propeller protein